MKLNKEIISKLRICILVVILIGSLISNFSHASDVSDGGETTGSTVINENRDVEMFIEDQGTKVEKLIRNTAETTIAALRISSVAIAIVFLLVIGMRYMISSSGDRADIKKHAVAYVVGAFVLFSVPQIVALLIQVADKLFSGADNAEAPTE